MNPIKNEIGNKYGKLTVIKQGTTTKNGTIKWLCSCECGNETEVIGYSLRSGITTSCGCNRGRKEEFEGSHVYKRSYGILKRSSKQNNRTLELSFEEWKKIVQQNCYYCGSDPYNKRYAYSSKRYNKGIEQDNIEIFNGVDRIDSSKGYIKENVVSCCVMCNRMKSDFNQQAFFKQIKLIYNNILNNGK
jgi:hypothetical protein